MDENQKQKSSVDRVNDLINNSKGVYQKGKQAKKVIQSIRLARTIATTGQGFGLGAVVTIVLVSLLLATLFLTFMGGGIITGTEAPEEEPLPEDQLLGWEYALDAPAQVNNGQVYTYRTYGSYDSGLGGAALESYTMTLIIPNDVIRLEGLPGTYSTSADSTRATTRYTWDLSDEENIDLFEATDESYPPFYTFSFTATATPLKDDSIASVEFTIEGEFGGGGDGARCTVGTTNTCGGKYNLNNPDGLNFGDPNCELTTGGTINKELVRDEIMRQLQSYGKTKDYCRWSCIAKFEGGYNPNSYNGNASRAHGAWGMFQLSPWSCYGSEKPYYYNRTGNVSWKEQIRRALALQYRMLEPNNLDWRYWSTYKWTCSKEPDWSSGTTCRSVE